MRRFAGRRKHGAPRSRGISADSCSARTRIGAEPRFGCPGPVIQAEAFEKLASLITEYVPPDVQVHPVLLLEYST